VSIGNIETTDISESLKVCNNAYFALEGLVSPPLPVTVCQGIAERHVCPLPVNWITTIMELLPGEEECLIILLKLVLTNFRFILQF
jgi:hypothetical protein